MGDAVVMPLSGQKVLDLTNSRGFLCGRVLADLGADVIKIEKPGGDHERRIGPFLMDRNGPDNSLPWMFYNLNKRSMELDIETEEGIDIFKCLVRQSHFVIESFTPGYLKKLGLGYEQLSEINPGLIYTSITPYGSEGPYSGFKGSDINCWGMGVMMSLCGDQDRAPVQISFPQAFLHASLHGAAACMIAHYHWIRTGEGQYIDVSAQASVYSGPPTDAPEFWFRNRQLIKRGGAVVDVMGTGAKQRLVWPCKDGYVLFVTMGGVTGKKTMDALVKWMDSEGMANDVLKRTKWEEFDVWYWTQDQLDIVEPLLGEFFKKHTLEELYEESIKRRIMLYPLSTVEYIASSPQLKDRDFWFKIPPTEGHAEVLCPGPFAKMSATPIGIRRRPPRIGEHTGEILCELHKSRSPSEIIPIRPAREGMSRNALEGIKVADFAWVATGPLITRTLAAHGATVVRIESSSRLDVLRLSPPYSEDRQGINRSGFFNKYNYNKLGVTLNLNHPGAKEVAVKLVQWADVVTSSFAVGMLERWGLGYDDLIKINPTIIMLSTSNQGQTGRHAQVPGFGYQLAGLAGFANLTGWPDREPATPYGAYTDFPAPYFGFCALMAAIEYRRKTGKGQYIDVSQWEAGLNLLAVPIMDYLANDRSAERMGNRHRIYSPHGAFRCLGNDRWCTIAVTNEEEWLSLSKAMGNPEWTVDPRFTTMPARKNNEDDLERHIEQWTINYEPQEIMHLLQWHGVPAGMVRTPADIYDDPQLHYRHHFATLRHREVGDEIYERPPFILSRTPARLNSAAPCLGEHSDYVYKEILGFSQDEIARFKEDGVFD